LEIQGSSIKISFWDCHIPGWGCDFSTTVPKPSK
jgi:hypothetical protein